MRPRRWPGGPKNSKDTPSYFPYFKDSKNIAHPMIFLSLTNQVDFREPFKEFKGAKKVARWSKEFQ